jgi:hypothetical protein
MENKIAVTCECNEAPTVDQLISHLEKRTGFRLEDTEDEGDRTAADYADAEVEVTE